MFDSILFLFLPFLISFLVTYSLSNIFISHFNQLKLSGGFNKSKRTFKSESVGSTVIFSGGSLSISFLVIFGFVPATIFVISLSFGILLLVIGFRFKLFALSNRNKFLFTLSFSIVLVSFLLPHYNNVFSYYGFIFTVFFAISCTYLLRALNILKNTAILFSIGITLSASIAGIYNEDAIICGANFSVIGSLIAFTFFNFSNLNNIRLGFIGELLIGFSIAIQGMYFFNTDTLKISATLPFFYILISYPLIDALQYFASYAFNIIFDKKIKVCQIHDRFTD